MKLLRILTLLLAGCVAQASSATDNASIHRRYLSADRSRYADEVVYYDGLGRPVETVRRGATPSGQSVVSLLEYDGAGRPVRAWCPVVGDGAFMPAGAVSAVAEALYGDSHAFTTTIYQKSPLAVSRPPRRRLRTDLTLRLLRRQSYPLLRPLRQKDRT